MSKYCLNCGSILQEVNELDDTYLLCNKCGYRLYNTPTVSIICLVEYNNKYLICRQPHVNNKYSIISGYLKENETLEECVKREVKEEIGLDVIYVKYISSYLYPKKNLIMPGFLCSISTDEILTSDEIESYEFVDAETAKEYLKETVVGIKLLNDILK